MKNVNFHFSMFHFIFKYKTSVQCPVRQRQAILGTDTFVCSPSTMLGRGTMSVSRIRKLQEMMKSCFLTPVPGVLLRIRMRNGWPSIGMLVIVETSVCIIIKIINENNFASH